MPHKLKTLAIAFGRSIIGIIFTLVAYIAWNAFSAVMVTYLGEMFSQPFRPLMLLPGYCLLILGGIFTVMWIYKSLTQAAHFSWSTFFATFALFAVTLIAMLFTLNYVFVFVFRDVRTGTF